MRTAVFVIGGRSSGKSTIIKSLTGCSRNGKLWKVRSLGGRRKKAFIILSSPQENKKIISPMNFPAYYEHKYNIHRNDYNILICALELSVRTRHESSLYIDNAIHERFDVKLGIITVEHDRTPSNKTDIASIKSYATAHSLAVIELNASDDPNKVSSLLRRKTYPK